MYQYGKMASGMWTRATGDTFRTHNPARPAETVGEYTASNGADVTAAVTQAGIAQTDWGRMPPVERCRLVHQFLDRVEAHTEAIAESVTREQGKPLGEARGECGTALREARYMATQGQQTQGELVSSQRTGVRNLILRRPRGVIGAISPWNFPVLTPMRKIAPALVYGNAIVLKPSEYTPAAAYLLADAARDILPDNVLQILNGAAETGQALVSHPDVQGVTFTGSVPTGRMIYQAAAANLTEVSLELGGKNAAVINDTDDLEGCLEQVANAAFQCAGQRCTAISRVIVAARLEEAVLEGLAARARDIKLGDGMSSDTTMGPLINANQLSHVERLV